MLSTNASVTNFIVRKPKNPLTNSVQNLKIEKEPTQNDKIIMTPSVAKFAGYEINKLNIVRIKLQNKTVDPVRIHVLPFNNQFFQTKINKRGLLLPRSSDDLFVYFRPTQYKIYYDEARVNIDSDIIILPIHAYPVIDRDNIQEIFPRIINFGKVYLGEKEIQRIPIRCKIPLNFSFEFFMLEQNECINIYPTKGTIPGNGYIDIEVWFAPQKIVNENKIIREDRDEKNLKDEKDDDEYVAKYELRTSQFDFEPLKITIKGQCIKVGRNLIYNKNNDKDGLKENLLSSQKDRTPEESMISIGEKEEKQSRIPSLDNLRPTKEKVPLMLSTQKQNNSILPLSSQNDQSQIQNPLAISLKSDEDDNQSLHQSSHLQLSRILMPKSFFDLDDGKKQMIKKVTNLFKKKSDLYSDLTEDKKHDGTKMFKVILKAKIQHDSNNRAQFENIFLERFSRVSNQDEKKSLKFFSCIGDKNITKVEVSQVREQRVDFLNKKRNELEQKGIKRFDLELNKDAPIIEQIVPNFDCKWDLSKNDKEKRKNIVLKRLLSYVAKLILMTRLKDNCNAISDLIKNIKYKFNKEQQSIEIDKAKKQYHEQAKVLNETYQQEKNKVNQEIEATKNLPKDATIEQKERDLQFQLLSVEGAYSKSLKLARLQFEDKERQIKSSNYLSRKEHRADLKEYVKKLVIEDWQKVEYTNFNKKSGGKGNFQFEFEEHNVARTFYPIQYESYNTFQSFKYEVNPRTGFDDYAPIEIISQCDSEVMQYRNWEVPPLIHYPPIEEQRVYRTGAEEEYSTKGRIGNQDKIEDKKEKNMPKTLTYKLDMPSYSLLLPHSTLRTYEKMIPITEIDPDFYLNPTPFFLQDELDPNESEITINGETNVSTQASTSYLNEVLEHDYLSKIPGLNSSHITKHLQVELYTYFRNKLQVPSDCGNIKNIDYGLSVFKGQPDYEDHLSDDEEYILDAQIKSQQNKNEKQKKNPKDKNVENVAQFLKQIEEDDEELAKLKQIQQEEIFDELEDTQANISIGLKAEKYKWVATMPSKTNEYNRFIYNNKSKLYI
ncbi:hypothetical protein ABPG72_004827 [Tetrahymena utriculariae]